MKGHAQFLIGLAAGLWGYVQIPARPEDGCITLLVGGLLMVSSLGRMLGIGESLNPLNEADPDWE